jgi:hypothetical protein
LFRFIPVIYIYNPFRLQSIIGMTRAKKSVRQPSGGRGPRKAIAARARRGAAPVPAAYRRRDLDAIRRTKKWAERAEVRRRRQGAALQTAARPRPDAPVLSDGKQAADRDAAPLVEKSLREDKVVVLPLGEGRATGGRRRRCGDRGRWLAAGAPILSAWEGCVAREPRTACRHDTSPLGCAALACWPVAQAPGARWRRASRRMQRAAPTASWLPWTASKPRRWVAGWRRCPAGGTPRAAALPARWAALTG